MSDLDGALLRICLALIAMFGSLLTGLLAQVLITQHRHTIILEALQTHLGIKVDKVGKVITMERAKANGEYVAAESDQ